MCEVASWIPSAVSATLGDKRAAQPIIAWLFNLRASIEEYDPLVIVRPPSPDEEDSSTPDRAFDEILSQLGREIFNLDEYRKKFTPQDAEVSLSILNIFDECLDTMAEDKADLCESDTEVPVKSVVNGADDCSDCESTLSNISSLANIPVCETKDLLEQTLAKQDERPIPAPRTIIKSQSSTSVYEIVNLIKDDVNRATESDSNSVSTSWSYKECNSSEECIPNTENPNDYGALWSHSSGFHNSDKILQTVLLKNQATISRVDFETASEFTPADYNVYSLHEVGDRCDTNTNKSPVAAMPATNDDGYEPVRDAITTDENIYEEIEFGCSYTDEGCSSGGSVEVESLSMSASSEGIGRESPFYVNLRDNDAYSVPPDVKYWMRTLADPFCNEDEEDEWISPEEYTVYTRDQRPPLVIPRITQYRPPPRQSQVKHVDYQQDDVQSLLISNSARQHYDRLHDASPVAEKSMLDLEKSYIKSSGSDKSSLSRSRIFGSTENVFGAKRPTHLNLPASSSGDSLDVEFRDNRRITPAHLRNGRARSAIATKSPVPPPRIHLQPSIEASVVFETPLKRTKYFESGKKSKKNWTECYMILTHTALVFYKDYRTYQASKVQKPPGAPASPNAPRAELVLPLRNAHVVRCLQMHTKRFTKSVLLTVGYDQYLLQDDSEDGARRLLMLIQNTIFKLGPPLPEDVRSALHSQSSSTDLDSLGRTPPTSRRTKNTKQKAGGSSNEDLSDSTESSVQKSQVKSRLKKFFAKRPAMEVLVKKGIYKDEPVFGKNLEEVCPQTSPRVPDFVVACIKEIESSEENMCTDGLYRASGNLSQVQKIRLEIDQNNLSVLENSLDIHVLTGSLKLFFRELKEPVIPRNMFHRVLSACSIKPREAKIREFRDIIQSLPQCNKDTLKFLLEHLLRVTQYSEQNRMHTANLAIVFGPTLLWAPAAQAHNIAVDCIQQNNVVDILLTEFKEIFTEDNSKGKKKT